MLFCIFAVILLVDSLESILLVHGPRTPPALKSYFNSTMSLMISSSSDSIDYSTLESPSFILDISLDPNYFISLESISSFFNVPYLTITKTQDFQFSLKRFFIFPPNRLEIESITAMIKYFEWEKFSVLLSNTEENLISLNILGQVFPDFQMKKYIYDKSISEENLDILIKRHIKTSNVQNLLVLDQGTSLETCVKLLKLRKLEQFGNYILFGLTSGSFNNIEGSTELAYEIGNNVNSREEFYIEAINHVLSKFITFTFEDFNNICIQNLCLKHFIILNIKNGKKVEVGSINDSINITKEIIFPGNNTNIRIYNFRKKIPIMIANGSAEPSNIKNNRTSYTFNGALYAAELANLDQDFKDFEYVLIPTDCGNLYFDLNWSLKCFSNYIKNIGIAYITGFWDASSMGNALTLRAFNISIPQISASSGSGFLNNKTAYPEFLKMSPDTATIFHNSMLIYKFFNWRDVLVLTTDGRLDKLRYPSTINLIENAGLRIINPEEYRFVPENYTRVDFDKIRPILEYLKNTRCRIIFFFITEPKFILEALYDVGFRRGDLIMYIPMMTFYTSSDKDEEIYLNKQLEILDGALTPGYFEYQYDYGKQIEKYLKERYSPIINMCNTFDTFLTISNSVKYLSKKGEDYEDPHILIHSMRNMRFRGCSGDVFFSNKDNSRSREWISYYQLMVNKTTKDYDFNQYIGLSRFSVVASRIINKAVWPTGEESIPTNYRITSSCVYSSDKQKSKNGLLPLHIVSILLFCICIISALFSIKNFDSSIPEIKYNLIASFQDILYQLFFVLQCIQIFALDPRTGVLTQLTSEYNYFAGFNIMDFYDFKDDDYWILESWLIAIVLADLVLVVLAIMFLKKSTKYTKYLEYFIEIILPFIGHIIFMPLIFMLMSIYECSEGVNDSITGSFLSRDCSTYCYKGKHLNYAIISSLSLALFVSISTLMRPFWETIQPGLRIRSKPKYWNLLSIFQLVLILIKVNVEPHSEVISGYLISAVIFAMILATYKLKPFNYDKLVSNQITLLTMNLWAFMVSTTFSIVKYEKIAPGLLAAGLIVIYLLGSRKFGNSSDVFISDEPNLISDLIKFQFSPDKTRVRPESKYRSGDFNEMSTKVKTTNVHIIIR